MTDQVQPAVMPEFDDAAGLDALQAAGGRQPSNARSHGDAPKGATPPAASIPWPPPKTPEQFKQLVHQTDSIAAAVADMFGARGIEPLPQEVTDETANGLWPLAYYYGAGGDKPTKGVLITYAALSIAGLVLLHLAQIKAQKDKDAQKKDARPALEGAGA